MEKNNVYISKQFIVPTIHIFEDSNNVSSISSPKSASSVSQNEYNISLSRHTNSTCGSITNIPIFEENIIRISPSSIQSDYSFEFSSIASSIQEDDSILHNEK